MAAAYEVDNGGVRAGVDEEELSGRDYDDTCWLSSFFHGSVHVLGAVRRRTHMGASRPWPPIDDGRQWR